MSTIISGNTPSSFGDDVSAVDITANSLTLPTAPVVGYQQGLWVPTMDNGTNTDNPGQNVWSRIGNTVTLHGFCNSWTDFTTAAAITVQGLPYSFTYNQTGGSVMTTRSGVAVHTAFLSAAAQGILFYQSASSTAGSWASLFYSDTNAATQIRFKVSYFTDDTTWVPSNGATVL